jgi:DNA polymerase V
MTTKVVAIHPADRSTACARPVFLDRVSAGFPSPADDYLDGTLDLNQYLITHPTATFFVRVTGESMLKAGIHSGDMLIVDRSLEPVDGKVVIAVLDGELTVKRLLRRDGKLQLVAEHDAYPPLDIEAAQTLDIWGVVTHVIHSL